MRTYRWAVLFWGCTLPLFAKTLITPIPEAIPYDHAKAALGKRLFSDPGLSSDGTISCESCHHLSYNGADSVPLSKGVKGRVGDRNAPTVFNALFNTAQFWDGRARNLKEQAAGPMHNPKEMDTDIPKMVQRLRLDPSYRKAFARLYADGVTFENVTDAIAEFEKSLTTPDSPFDRYLKGDQKALNATEKAGYALFRSFGCISCHNGVNIGGNLYQKLGVFEPYPQHKRDLGRYEVTHKEKDRYFFKVPSLRNVARTAPYLHDGSVAELNETIALMLRYQLGREATREEIDKIAAFLRTLNGRLPLEEKRR